MAYSVRVLLEQDSEFSQFLKRMIREFNNAHSVHHRQIREAGAVHYINIIVADEAGQWIGGISAEVYWEWMEINDFWLRDDARGHGLGKSLLVQAEKAAVEMGAARALLTTFSFQARGFYERCGYRVVGEIQDYPPGSTYYTMVKMLA